MKIFTLILKLAFVSLAVLLLVMLLGGSLLTDQRGQFNLRMSEAQAAPVPPEPVTQPVPRQGPPGSDPAGFLTGPSAGDSLDIALRYIRANQKQLRLTDDDLADYVIKDHYVSQHNGVTHLYLRQRYQGIEVFNGDIAVNITAYGAIINLHNGFISDLKNRVNTVTPALSPAEAVNQGAQALGLALTEPLRPLQNIGGPEQEILLSDGGLTYDGIPVRLMYQLTARGEARLVWNASLNLRTGQNWWNIRVDAVTGQLLSRNDWIVNETYTVFEAPKENPAEGARTSVNDPFTAGGLASPQGWHDTNGGGGPEFTITRGNNVHAYADTDNNGLPDALAGSQPEGGPTLTFNPPLDLNLEPQGYLAASVVNLFYWNNIIHDVFYQYGFDEAAGNFQQNNFSNGGAGSDYVKAEAQDGADGGNRNNANFATPPDGTSGRMQMYLWDQTSPERDGDLDNGIILHEYGHGISTRLTGGPSNSSCLSNPEQMGEGWSDWIALVLTAVPADTPTTHRAMGTYVLGQSASGGGIRPAPYTTDMAINGYTYNNIKTQAIPHGVGFVWATMLWDMYWLLVGEHGYNPNLYAGWDTGGNNLALQLVVDGMKLQPCNPGFVTGRNAILQADQALTGGQNQCLIWQAFARRGLGFSAAQGSSNSTQDGVQAFDMPPSCQFGEIKPPLVNICLGQNAVYTMSLGSSFTPPVNFNLTGQPAGTSVTFNPPSPAATIPFTSLLTIGNTGSATPGAYTLAVTANGGVISKTFNTGLNLFDDVPLSAPVSPPDLAINVPIAPTLTWTDIGPTAATSYKLEIATDNSFTNIIFSTTVTTTSYTVDSPALQPQTVYFWRISPQNPCGNTTSTIYRFATEANAPILLVDDDDNTPNVRDAYVQALQALGRDYDLWDTKNSDNEPDAAFLDRYQAVIWFIGDAFDSKAGPGSAAETSLGNWLSSSGKCLMISGQDYLYAKAGNGLTPFMQNYLGLASAGQDVEQTIVTGAGVVFGDLGSYPLNFPFGYTNYSDALTPNATAVVAFNGNQGNAAINKETAAYRTAFLAFPFETLPAAADRQEVLDRFLGWCDDAAPLRPKITLAGTGGLEKLSLILAEGNQSVQPLTLRNTGSAALTWSLVEDGLAGAGVAPATAQGANLAALRRRVSPSSPPDVTPQVLSDIVADGSFEQGTPNPVWQEFSTYFGTPLCDATCAEGPAPRTGDYYAWFGGIALNPGDPPEIGVLTQTVTLRASPVATLTFYLLIGVCDSNDDFLSVYIDGNQIFDTGTCLPGYDYARQTIDLSAYADGGSHELVFYSETHSTNGQNSNFFVDDVQIEVQDACDSPSDIPWVTNITPTAGTLAANNQTNVNVTFDSTGLSDGVYEATLCLSNNDPRRPLIQVPLTLRVGEPAVYLPIIRK